MSVEKVNAIQPQRGPASGRPTYAWQADDSVVERFWAKVNVRGVDECWLWTAYTNKYGYGSFKTGNHSPVPAHRWAYEYMTNRPVGQGLTLDHLCKVRNCCNPRHLEPVTPKVNVERSSFRDSAARRKEARTHCPQGHPYSPENTRMKTSQGRTFRVCRTCHGPKR